MLRRLAKRRLARIETDIRLLEKRLTETIAAEADLARRYARLTSAGLSPWRMRLMRVAASEKTSRRSGAYSIRPPTSTNPVRA